MRPKTSSSDPIKIAEVRHPDYPGAIGVTICPGKKAPSTFGGSWDRDLTQDLELIQSSFTPETIITLMPSYELAEACVPGLGERISELGIQWRHMPIEDMEAPGGEFEVIWKEAVPEIIEGIQTGANVLIHCRGGLGRSGTVAAITLIEMGMSPEQATKVVREARPGAIETNDQETYVRRYVRSGLEQ